MKNSNETHVNVNRGGHSTKLAHKFSLPCKKCGYQTPKVSRLGKALTILEAHWNNCNVEEN